MKITPEHILLEITHSWRHYCGKLLSLAIVAGCLLQCAQPDRAAHVATIETVRIKINRKNKYLPVIYRDLRNAGWMAA
jgi:hypothetical protein